MQYFKKMLLHLRSTGIVICNELGKALERTELQRWQVQLNGSL
jgi:hypothetical protein